MRLLAAEFLECKQREYRIYFCRCEAQKIGPAMTGNIYLELTLTEHLIAMLREEDIYVRR